MTTVAELRESQLAEFRLHQDEWLASLRSATELGCGSRALYVEPRCVIGRAVALAAPTYTTPAGLDPRLDAEGYLFAQTYLGISALMISRLWKLSDGWSGQVVIQRLSPSEVADWFKEQRDLWNGDLTAWVPA